MNIQLKTLRTKRRLSQEDMANRLGIKVSRYGTWERGERNMSLAQACEVADILGCTLDELAGRWDYVKSPSFSDARQTALNEEYEQLSDIGKDSALGAIRGMRLSERARGEADGTEGSQGKIA